MVVFLVATALGGTMRSPRPERALESIVPTVLTAADDRRTVELHVVRVIQDNQLAQALVSR